jgi:two-component system nitrate/nitrite response regulator NarL
MRILVVEDQGILKSAINDILFLIRDVEIIHCSDYKEAMFQIERNNNLDSGFKLVISDLQFANGFKSFKVLEIAKSFEIPSMVFSMHENKMYILEALKYGVRSYVSKMEHPEELEKAVKAILRGDTYFSAYIKSILNKECNFWTPEKLNLTKMETQLLHCFAQGLSFKQIVEKYNLNENTLRNHRRQMLYKNNCNFEQLLASYHAWPPEFPFCESILLKSSQNQ